MPLDVDSKVTILIGATSTGAGTSSSMTVGGRVAVEARGTTSSGTGAAVIEIQVSSDNSAWQTAGTINLDLGTAQVSDRFAMDASWPYVRANVKSISGTGASVSVYKITGVNGVTATTDATGGLDISAGLPMLMGDLTSGEWFPVGSIFRLLMTGTGTVTLDSKDALGAITTSVYTVTLTGATNQIGFPYAGDAAVQIRATLTGTATAKVI